MKILLANLISRLRVPALLLALSLTFIFSSCKDDPATPENLPTKSIMELVGETTDVSTLKAAIEIAGLEDALNGDGPFTVFAPTNAAFEAFSTANPDILDYLLENPEELSKVLTYHVVAAEAKSTDLIAGPLATLNGQTVAIDLTNGVKVNDASVTTADVLATNGVIHLIDKVLVPDNLILPELVTENIMGIVDMTTTVSTLKAAIDAASLRQTLDGEGPFTVFAPSDAAFEAFSAANPGVLEFLLLNPAELAKVLTYHVVAGKVASTDLTAGSVATVNGETVAVDLMSGVMVNDAKVTIADIEATNGIIHVIDKVLVPKNVIIPTNLGPDGTVNSIAEIAIGTESLSSLVAILSLDGLSEELAAAANDGATLTVFAPTNDAFAEVLAALGLNSISEIPEEVLRDIVRYHIVGSVAKSTDLTATTYPTLNGESVSVELMDGVMVDNAKVISADIIGSNGVVHVIDKVLLPSLYKSALGTIVEVPLFRKSYSTLTAALVKAELVETLLGNGPFTVFAPDNAAFEAAGITSLEGLTKEDLTPILLYHVLGSKVLSSQLPGDGVVTTLNSGGADKFFLSLGSTVYINGSTKITGVDIEKSNGVIHTIDRTLTPPTQTIVDIAVALSQAETPEFTTLVSLLTAPERQAVLATLTSGDLYTVFAPTDAAFAEIAAVTGTLTEQQITDVLTYHVVSGRIYSSDLTDGIAPATVNGQTLTISVGSGVTIADKDLTNTDATVISANVNGTNGVIHVIDKVLIPTL